jgi:predicted DNA binding CopG/RHH family protein
VSQSERIEIRLPSAALSSIKEEAQRQMVSTNQYVSWLVGVGWSKVKADLKKGKKFP